VLDPGQKPPPSPVSAGAPGTSSDGLLPERVRAVARAFHRYLAVAEERPATERLTFALLAVAAAVSIWTAVWDQGMLWPDEIFQTLEQGHRFAFGRGITPWEFRDGARSWVYPGLIGLGWKAASAVGVTNPLTLVRLAKLGMAAASFWGVWAGTRLARRLGGESAMVLAAAFGALCPPLVIFGSRCTTEIASAPLVMVAALLIETEPRARRTATAGALVALSVLFRYQNGVVAVAFLLTLLARRRWADVRAYILGALSVAAAGGAVDWVVWGRPFKPLFVYMKFNTSRNADQWGTAPFAFFAEHLGTTIGVSYGILILGFFVAARRMPAPAFVVLMFILVHSMVPHKELRFIDPVLPLAVSIAAVGLGRLMDGLEGGRLPAYLLALVCGAQMAWRLRAPTVADLGYGTDGGRPIWHAGEDYYRATALAASLPDLCGISYIGTPKWWTGGYTFLHRDVPVFFDTDAKNLAAANYIVGGRDEHLPEGWAAMKVYRQGWTLYHRAGACGPVPAGWNTDL
jgi:GPI mannosyltransferase 3